MVEDSIRVGPTRGSNGGCPIWLERRALRIAIVVSRGGRTSIHWQGVLLAFLLLSGTVLCGGGLLQLALRQTFMPTCLVALIPLPSIVIGTCIRRGQRLPPSELPVVD